MFSAKQWADHSSSRSLTPPVASLLGGVVVGRLFACIGEDTSVVVLLEAPSGEEDLMFFIAFRIEYASCFQGRGAVVIKFVGANQFQIASGEDFY